MSTFTSQLLGVAKGVLILAISVITFGIYSEQHASIAIQDETIATLERHIGAQDDIISAYRYSTRLADSNLDLVADMLNSQDDMVEFHTSLFEEQAQMIDDLIEAVRVSRSE